MLNKNDIIVLKINEKNMGASKVILNDKDITNKLKLTEYDFKLLNDNNNYYKNLENLINEIMYK